MASGARVTWNHRVIRHLKDDPGLTYLAIHEVYYTDNIPDSITDEPIKIIGDDIEDIKQELKMILKCLEHPILDFESFGNRSDVE